MKNKSYRQSWVVFQPHTYSRTKTLLDDFANSLMDFDNIIITDIYAARETNTYGISSIDLVNKINELGKNAIYISDFDDIANAVWFLGTDASKNISGTELVIDGAMSVQLYPQLLNELKKEKMNNQF